MTNSKRRNVSWKGRNREILITEVARLKGSMNWKMCEIYEDVSRRSEHLFGVHLSATHVQKQASKMHRAENTKSTQTMSMTGWSVMYNGRQITHQVLEQALKMYDMAKMIMHS
jgi:hypothetical protein